MLSLSPSNLQRQDNFYNLGFQRLQENHPSEDGSIMILDATSGSKKSVATSAVQTLCFCEQLVCFKIAYSETNLGSRSVNCENYKTNNLLGILNFKGHELHNSI